MPKATVQPRIHVTETSFKQYLSITNTRCWANFSGPRALRLYDIRAFAKIHAQRNRRFPAFSPRPAHCDSLTFVKRVKIARGTLRGRYMFCRDNLACAQKTNRSPRTAPRTRPEAKAKARRRRQKVLTPHSKTLVQPNLTLTTNSQPRVGKVAIAICVGGGQGCVLHFSFSLRCGHAFPPCACSVSVPRVRSRVPPPQGWLHLLHCPHLPTSQSTAPRLQSKEE